MLSLCQKVAVEASTVGMLQFQEMYNTVEVLLHNWQTGLKCIVVTCSDESKEVTSNNEVAMTTLAVQHDEGVTQHEDATQHGDDTQYEDNTQYEDGYEDGTQYEDDTQYVTV